MTIFKEADLIYAYSRSQAIEDGKLIDVSETAKEAGILYPVAITRQAWAQIVEPDQMALSHGESVEGRLWDVLYMFYLAAKRGKGGDRLIYEVIATDRGKQRIRKIKAICGPGDNALPVITLMLPYED